MNVRTIANTKIELTERCALPSVRERAIFKFTWPGGEVVRDHNTRSAEGGFRDDQQAFETLLHNLREEASHFDTLSQSGLRPIAQDFHYPLALVLWARANAQALAATASVS